MQTRFRISASVLALLMGAMLTFGASPVSAEDRDRCPPGQPPGRPPGRPPTGNSGPEADNSKRPDYPPGRCRLELSRTFAERSGAVSATGDGFVPGEAITLSVAGRNVAELTAGPDGTFSTTFTVPADAPLGATQVRATSATQVLSANFEVVASAATRAGAPASESSGLLARTGQEFGTVISLGFSLIVIGAVLVLIMRRRRAAVAGGTL